MDRSSTVLCSKYPIGLFKTLTNRQRPASYILAGRFYVCTAGAPAVYFSVLASSVIIVAAGSGLLPPCIVPPLGLLQYHSRKRRYASCINYQVCARGAFRSQTARPVTIKRFPHFNSQGQKQGKTELFIAVDLREM